MKDFRHYKDLILEINNDKELKGGHAVRYPLRFILLDDFDRFQELVEELDVKKVNLPELMDKDNAWFGVNSLVDIVKEQTESAVIYPLSEVLRFFEKQDFDGFLHSVLLLQNDHKIRIYIPLVGLLSQFKTFWNNFNRKEESAPVWRLNTFREQQKTITVYCCSEDIDSRFSTINSNKEWLNYWNTKRESPLITKAKSLVNRWDRFLPDACFEKDRIDNAKDVLGKIMKISFVREYKDFEKEYWQRLLAHCEETESFRNSYPNRILEKILGITDYLNLDDEEILKLYLAEQSSYERWLLLLLVNENPTDESYLNRLLNETEEPEANQIIRDLYFKIFEHYSPAFVKQRKKLIESLPDENEYLVKYFIDAWFERLKKSEHGIDLCTNYSKKEREYIIMEMVKSLDFNAVDNVYPDLAAYLNWDKIKTEEKVADLYADYFKEYAMSKVLNEKTNEFEKLFDILNANKDSFFRWYYHFKPKQAPENYKLIQFDGVGAEWLPYILHCIKELGAFYSKEVESFHIQAVELPSITKINKKADAEFIRDYDKKIIHRIDHYQYPMSLIESLHLIKEMVRKYVMMIPDKKILITADHGSSIMSLRRFGAISMHPDLEAKHAGRYYSGDERLADNDYFFNYNDCYIALKNHVLASTVSHEVHGGATPEEVLVPFILVKESKHLGVKDYQVEILEHTLSYEQKTLELMISPSPKENPVFRINNEILEASRKDKFYVLDLTKLDAGVYNVNIEVGNFVHKEKITICSGFIEEDLFND